MVALFILTLLILGAVIAFACMKAARDPDARSVARLTGVILSVLSVVTLALASFTHTKSNEISINHNFGTYQGTTGPGITFVGPFTQSEKFTTRIQTHKVKKHKVTLKAEKEGASGAPATVWYTIRYHIDGTKHAEKMWRQYRNFEKVTDDLVVPESKTTANEVFGAYTPAESQAGGNRRAQGNKLRDGLNKALDDDGIVIDSVSVTTVDLPQDVEARLSAVQKAAADAQKKEIDAKSRQAQAAIDAQTRLDTAKKDKATAAEQAAADRFRKSTVTRETLVQECLRLAEKLNQPLNCNYYMTNQYAPVPR
jgi:regulator of protease activity HflC (stomatin/prohibitin superfamily)